MMMTAATGSLTSIRGENAGISVKSNFIQTKNIWNSAPSGSLTVKPSGIVMTRPHERELKYHILQGVTFSITYILTAKSL